jgi:hypothetical protein
MAVGEIAEGRPSGVWRLQGGAICFGSSRKGVVSGGFRGGGMFFRRVGRAPRDH